MKYKDILQFEPITEVIQIDQLSKADYRKDIIRTFVYPQYFVETVIPEIVRNLKFGEREQKGIQIIGNYGTGKSHMMSLVSLIAENADYLSEVKNEQVTEVFQPIAGKFAVCRFEMQTQQNFWSIITYQLQQFLDINNVDYRFDDNSLKMYGDQLDDMMAAFEDKYPDKGVMLVIDEVLSYLRGHAAVGQLDIDLQVLQALGQQCSKGRFTFMYGVQEMIYQSREFAFAAEMLLRVKDRYIDITIRKEDVSFVVQNRLLRKSESQLTEIRKHLEPFRKYFSELHSKFEEYVGMFPVHPAYFDNFQRIRLGRAQREVLKTLSKQFERLKDTDIPSDNPGLITYDHYWEQMMADSALMTIPDFKSVAETVRTVYDKIETNFTAARAQQIPLAKRIVNATAIKILQGELNKHNGAKAEVLVEDLCPTNPIAENKKFLVDAVDTCAQYIIRANSGQYFDKDEENEEFHLRTEGGVNFDQLIVQYAEQMSPFQKDEAFFRFLVEVLGIETNPYRTGFMIYTHELPWITHKITRDGYIFMGNPNEKSTTHPKQYFYMLFMPIFQEDKKTRNNEADEIYFVMDNLSDEFKTMVCNHGAAFSLMNAADSAQKSVYKGKMEDFFLKTRRAFEASWLQAVKVYYKNEGKTISTFSLPAEGSSKLEIFNNVTSNILEYEFVEQTPHYPAFTLAKQTIGRDNIARYIQGAFAKIVNPEAQNQDGQAILAGLGCFALGEISITDSIYAQSVLSMMAARDENHVVNRDEILEFLPNSSNIWRSKDYQIDAAFEFIVLAVLTVLGECEIRLNSGDILNASSLDKLRTLQSDDYFNFAFIKRPKGINLPVIKAITKAFCGKDLSNRLDQTDTYVNLVNTAKRYAAEAARVTSTQLQTAIVIAGVEIMDEDKIMTLRHRFTAFKGFCDRLSSYTSEAKLKNMPFDLNEVNKMIENKELLDDFQNRMTVAGDLNAKVSYLTQARQYVPQDGQLAQSINDAVSRFTDIITNPSDELVSAYNTQLDQAKKDYIDYYLKRYREYCINDIDDTKRTEILQSGEYAACQELQNCTLLNATHYTTWRTMFSKLRKADPQAEAKLQSSPYVDFNPLSNPGEMKTVFELRQELEDVYNIYLQKLKDFVASDDATQALSLMAQPDRDFANGFLQGMQPITGAHIARALVEFVTQLLSGFERVEISAADMTNYFNKPMNVDEAQAAFDKYIYDLCRGKKRDKVRIVLK